MRDYPRAEAAALKLEWTQNQVAKKIGRRQSFVRQSFVPLVENGQRPETSDGEDLCASNAVESDWQVDM